MDCTNSEAGNVLNTPDVKVKVLDRYGPIHHPTLSEMTSEWPHWMVRISKGLCSIV